MNKKSHGEIEEAVVESTVTHRGKELDVIARHINDGTSIYVIFHENGRLYNSYTDDKHGNRQGQELYFDDEGRLVEEVLWKNEAKIWQKSFTENEVYQHTYFLGKDNRFSKALEVHVEQLEAIGLKPTL